MFKYMAVLACVASASAAPQGYSAPGGRSSFGSIGVGSSFSSFGGGSLGGSSFGGGSLGGGFGGGVGGGAIVGGGGGAPEVTRNVYLYAAPQQAPAQVNPASIPARKVHYNFVFVRTANGAGGARPIVAPAPEQKTLVYVLSRRPSAQNQQVIEVPHNPTQPEVFFVNYDNEGDNTQLPGGVTLQQALSQSAQQGQVIQGGSGAGFSGGNSGGFSGGISGGFGGSSRTFLTGRPGSGYN